MPNIGGALANYGLMSMGMEQRAKEQRSADAETMGLEDMKREHEDQDAYRTAVKNTDPASGRLGAYHQVAEEALRRGDLGTREQIMEKSRKLQEDGWGALSMRALTGAPVDQAEQEFNNMGSSRIVPGTLEYGRDPKTGEIMVRANSVADGKPYTFNATQYARMHGIIKQAVHPIPAGGSLAITEPGQPTQVVGGRDKAFSPSQEVVHVERAVDGEKKTYAYNVAEKKWIGGAPPGEQGTPPEAESGAGTRKNLPVFKALNEAVSKIPGAVNKMDMSDPLHPYYEWTPKGAAYATRAERLYSANPKLTPEVIRDLITAHGQVLMAGGEEVALRVNGKTYKLKDAQAAAAQPAGGPPAAPASAQLTAPQPAPAQTAAAPLPASRPEQTPPGAPTPPAPAQRQAQGDELPELADPRSAGSPKARHDSRVASELAKRDAERRAKAAQKPIDTFRAIASSPTMSRDDIPLIEEAIETGKLTPAEELKAHRMLAKLRPQTAGR